VLQCASVIGRLFKYRLLDHLARHERDLDTHLTELESKELINAERTVPELEYAFKHALTQEATYQSILERKRQEFHHQVGDGIETLYQQKLEEYYGELAYHYTRSADKEKAVEYLIKAGDKCKQLYANQDAIRYFDEALSLLDKLDETNEHKIQRLKALESLGDVHQTIGKHNDAIACFEKAVELATKQRIATARLAELYSKMGSAYFFLDQYDKMIETGKSGLAVLGEDILCPQGALVFDNIREGYEYKGDREKAEEYASKNAAIVRDLGYFDGIDKVYTGIAFTNGFLKNDPRYSISWTQECMEICERHNDKKGIALCCHWLGDTFHFSMGSREALYWYRRSISIAEDIGYTDIMMWSHVDIGGMLFKWKEELGEAEEHLKIGADMASRMKNDYYTALACAWLGELYLFKQDWDKSIDYKVTMAEIICRGKVRPTGAVVPILRLSTTILLVKFLCNLEEACKKTGRKAEFFSLCGKLKEWIKEITQDFRLTQWYLEPKEISGQFTQTIFLDDFDGSDLCPEWQCIDPKGGCSYELDNESSWLVIQVDSGCDLYPESNFDALRLLQDISGDFAIETKIAPAEEMPTVGGLLVWKDRDSYIRFERGMHGTNEIGLSGSINGKWCPFGRGMLVSDNIYMRIERIGDILSSYCSRDGANWLTCGEVNFPVDDPVQIGIHAIGGVGSRGGNMATATRFDYFRVQK